MFHCIRIYYCFLTLAAEWVPPFWALLHSRQMALEHSVESSSCCSGQELVKTGQNTVRLIEQVGVSEYGNRSAEEIIPVLCATLDIDRVFC